MREYGGSGSELLIHFNRVSCSGTESMLTECGHSEAGTSSCEEAAVICSGEDWFVKECNTIIPT